MRMCYVLKDVDHTLNRNGNVCWKMVELDGSYVKIMKGQHVGWNLPPYKTKKALLEAFTAANDGTYMIAGNRVRHQNYSHWAGLEF